MQRQGNPLHIKVETCRNCHLHSWCTRHDQSKYNSFYQKLHTMVKTYLPNAQIQRNEPPAHYKKVYDSPQGPDRYIDENNNQVSFPRSGAFQVFVNGVQIFSKLKSSLWPSIERVVKLIMNIDKDLKQKADIQKYSLEYRLQNDHDFSFIQTYRAQLKRKQLTKIFVHEKSATPSANKNFKSRRLYSNSKTKKQQTQPEKSSPIINSKKFNEKNIFQSQHRPQSRDQHVRQVSDFNQQQQFQKDNKSMQIHKWRVKQEQNPTKHSPIFVKKSKVMQRLKNKSDLTKDKNNNNDKINLHKLMQDQLQQTQSKNSSKINENKNAPSKNVQQQEPKNQKDDNSGGNIKGWSDKQQKSDFIFNQSQKSKPKNPQKQQKQQVDMKKQPSINQNLQYKQQFDNQYILQQEQQKKQKPNTEEVKKQSNKQSKKYLKPNEQQDQKSYAQSNDKKSLHLQHTFSQKSLDLKNHYLIYQKIANWQAVYAQSQEDYEKYQFILLLMSKNFQSQDQGRDRIQSFQQLQQDANLFRVKEEEVKQIKYKQLVYHKYTQVNWIANYKNGFKLQQQKQDDYQSFCEQIVNQVDKIQEQIQVKNKKDTKQQLKQKNDQKRKQSLQKQAQQYKKFKEAVNINIQTSYQEKQHWVAQYQQNQFKLNKDIKLKVAQPQKNVNKQQKVANVSQKIVNFQTYKQEKWVAEYSGGQFILQIKQNKQKPSITQNIDLKKDSKNDRTPEAKKLQNNDNKKQKQPNIQNNKQQKWIAERSSIGFELIKKEDKSKLPSPNEMIKQVKVEGKKQAIDNKPLKSQVKPQKDNVQLKKQVKKDKQDKIDETRKNPQKIQINKTTNNKQVNQQENWTAEYSNNRFQLLKKEQKVTKSESKKVIDKKNVEIKQQIKLQNKKEAKIQVPIAADLNNKPIKTQNKKEPQKSIQIPKQVIKGPKEQTKSQNNIQKQIKKTQDRKQLPEQPMLWVGSYNGTQFSLKRDNTSGIPKTGVKKEGNEVKNNENKIKVQNTINIKDNKIQKDPNIVQWMGKFKNNQYILQKIIAV